MNETWSVKANGGKGGLVGIMSDKSSWFIAEEVLLKHAKLICELFNTSQPAVEADAQKPCGVCSDPAEGSFGDYCRHCGRYLRTA